MSKKNKKMKEQDLTGQQEASVPQTVTPEAPVKVLKITKTGLLDSFISENIAASYEDGAKDRIVAQVMEQLPDLDAKRLAGLYYSRRAVIKKASQKAQEVAA